MKLELGKKYVDRHGEIVGPMEATPDDHPFYETHPFIGNHSTFRADGSWGEGETGYDLIAEHRESPYVVGRVYVTEKGDKRTCIAVDINGAWLSLDHFTAVYYANNGKSPLGYVPIIFDEVRKVTCRITFRGGVADMSTVEIAE